MQIKPKMIGKGMKADVTLEETLRAVVHEDKVSFTANSTLRDNEGTSWDKGSIIQEDTPIICSRVGK